MPTTSSIDGASRPSMSALARTASIKAWLARGPGPQAIDGLIRDGVGHLAAAGALGEALSGPMVGYSAVYHLEILLLFATLIAIGPLVGSARSNRTNINEKFGLAEFPG